MLSKLATVALGLYKDKLETCPISINTSIEGSKKATEITIQPLLSKFKPNNVMDAATIKTKAFVIHSKSSDVLIVAMFYIL